MALEKYKAKRHFDKTPEPEGKKQSSPGKLKFCVQKHHASHLHYDFRLELDGVLKSWAVPKGPSLDPSVKRLAMMVEDHPYSYMRFEGTIPEGNYGAGQVIVWDIGEYGDSHGGTQAAQEKALRHGLHKGHLAITLKGKKLKGAFDLVKIASRGENAWLLIKKQDEYASNEDLTKLDKSAISSRHLPDPEPGASRGRIPAAKGKPAEITRVKLPDEEPKTKPREKKGRSAESGNSSAGSKKAKAEPRLELSSAPVAKTIPYPIKPMLCTLVDEPFDHDDWVFEVKWDGYRAIAEVTVKTVRLYSRNAKSFEQQYPTVFAELPKLARDCVVDGEIIALANNGRTSFQHLQNHGNVAAQIRYAIFDLLFLDGHDLRGLPLIERKALLQQIIKAAKSKVLVYSEHIDGAGEAYFAAAKQQGLEGVVAKKAQSKYHSSRGADWLKIKVHMRQEAVIGGFTAPRGSRTGFGALILGVYDGGKLRYIGHTGTGFTQRMIDELHARLLKLATPDCPFATKPKTNQPATWVKPQLLCEVEFTEWTGEGHMRHPSLMGLREDKRAKAVREEQPEHTESVVQEAKKAPAKRAPAKAKAPPRAASPTSTASQSEHQSVSHSIQTAAKLSSLDKLYWKDEGITKGQLLQYYHDIADWMIPFLKDRPQSLHRYPEGVGGMSFFQKDVEYKLPSFMKTHTMHSPGHGGDITWTIANNRDALLFLVNMGCIEINPWNSRVPKLEYVDWSVIDIDPDDDNTFEEVIGIAQNTRKVLDKLGIEGYPKTSGKTGLHIYIPLGQRYTHDQSKQFAHIIARMVHAQSPGNTSLERMPAKRKGRIYVDFLQNRSGATLAAPYSCRPAPGATVSMPLKWSEVRKGLSPAKFTIFNAIQRLEKVGDLWSPVMGPGIDLAAVLDRFAEPQAMAAAR